jgi:LacI family transcriptional regulator
MCSNDWFAYHAYQLFEKYKINVPEEISITGFDGINIPSFVKSPTPKLTTVFANRIKLGRAAVDLLIDTLENPQKKPQIVGMGTELRIGDSVRRL